MTTSPTNLVSTDKSSRLLEDESQMEVLFSPPDGAKNASRRLKAQKKTDIEVVWGVAACSGGSVTGPEGHGLDLFLLAYLLIRSPSAGTRVSYMFPSRSGPVLASAPTPRMELSRACALEGA